MDTDQLKNLILGKSLKTDDILISYPSDIQEDKFLDTLASAISIVAEDLAKREIYGNIDTYGQK